MVLGLFYGVEELLGLWGCPMEWRGLLGHPWVVVGSCGALEMAGHPWVWGNISGMQRAGKAPMGSCGAQGLSFLLMPLV